MSDSIDLNRLEKLEQLQKLNINPYPHKFSPSHSILQVLTDTDLLLESGEPIQIAGRLSTMREMGKAVFGHLKGQQTTLQFYVRKEEVSEEDFALLKLFDLGDYIGLSGSMMRTKKGELTLRVNNMQMLAKALRTMPIPKQSEQDGEMVTHDAVKDVEFRYRNRSVDLALNDEVANVFVKRSQIVSTIRSYLHQQGFLEVETPILQPIYGGAAATPFTTQHKTLDIPLYLRVATELYLKRLVAGGFDRVFEIGKDFRNEGIDRTHNPEFSMVEFYQAYADYHDMMSHFEQVYLLCTQALHGSSEFIYQNHAYQVAPPWRRMTMLEAVQTLGGIQFESLSDKEVQDLLESRHWPIAGTYSRGLALAEIFSQCCEEQLQQPTFITDFPKETTPLCKPHRHDPNLVERFEPYIAGWEVGNAYSELNDPIIQRQCFAEQVERRSGGDLEAHPYDEDFVRAMEYGMPPMGGVGIGIDRMVMLLTNQLSIRDVLLFPTMRPPQSTPKS